MAQLELTLDFNRLGPGAYETTCLDLAGFRYRDADLAYCYQLAPVRLATWFIERETAVTVTLGVFEYPEPERDDVILCSRFTVRTVGRPRKGPPRGMARPRSDAVALFLGFGPADEK